MPLVVMLVGFVGLGILIRTRSTRAGTEPFKPDDLRPAFDHVWMRDTAPQPAWRAYRERRVGTLQVDFDRREAVFRDRAGVITPFSEVVGVAVGEAGTDPVNVWVTVTDSNGMVRYLKDGAWLGWRGLLSASNRRLAASLSAIGRDAGNPA